MIIRVLVLFCFGFLQAQQASQPFKIKIRGDYTQPKSNIIFPKSLLNFERKEIVAFDKTEENIGSVYEFKEKRKISTISVYVYPANISTDNLRDQFLSFNVAINRIDQNVKYIKPEFAQEISDKVIVNGIQSIFEYKLTVPDYMKGQREQQNKSLVAIYDSGFWNLKIRITSENLSITEIRNLHKEILKTFNPARIAEENPILKGEKPRIIISKNAQADSLMINATIVEAEAKINWLDKNKSIKELSAGFSDFEIESHEYALNQKIEFFEMNDTKFSSKPETISYFNNLKKIRDAGFIKDLIFDQTFGIVIYPNGVNRKAIFKNFLEENKIPENISELMYRIYY